MGSQYDLVLVISPIHRPLYPHSTAATGGSLLSSNVFIVVLPQGLCTAAPSSQNTLLSVIHVAFLLLRPGVCSDTTSSERAVLSLSTVVQVYFSWRYLSPCDIDAVGGFLLGSKCHEDYVLCTGASLASCRCLAHGSAQQHLLNEPLNTWRVTSIFRSVDMDNHVLYRRCGHSPAFVNGWLLRRSLEMGQFQLGIFPGEWFRYVRASKNTYTNMLGVNLVAAGWVRCGRIGP